MQLYVRKPSTYHSLRRKILVTIPFSALPIAPNKKIFQLIFNDNIPAKEGYRVGSLKIVIIRIIDHFCFSIGSLLAVCFLKQVNQKEDSHFYLMFWFKHVCVYHFYVNTILRYLDTILKYTYHGNPHFTFEHIANACKVCGF